MGKYEKEWARRKRYELKETLGNKCAKCGKKKNLEFDCIIPQGDEHHRMDTSHRMSFYRNQYANNNLQLLCGVCNRLKALEERQTYPF